MTTALYTLHTENFGQASKLISRHRTLSAAVKADLRFQKSQRRLFGDGWTPTVISFDGERVSSELINELRYE